MSAGIDTRIYKRTECAVFRKTNEAFGGLSNMAPGFPVRVNGVRILTIEALYQASRFPHLPEVQRKIIDQLSPMTAKMVSKPHRKDSRDDWDGVRVKVMRWCLRLKLSQHWPKFSQLLLSTGDRLIVEDSRKDDFWGAVPNVDGTLVGMNVLGRLLMELREAIKQGGELRLVEPPAIANFLLFGEPLQVVDFRTDKDAPPVAAEATQRDLFDELTLPLFAQAAAAASIPKPATASVSPTTRSHGMIEGLKPYAEYKDSGLPWLDTVPKHWDMAPNRALMRDQRQVVGARASDYTLLSLTLRGVIARDMVNPKGKFPAQFNTYKVVRPDDFVFCLFDIDETPRGVGLSPLKGMITGAYDIFSPTHRINPRLLYHYYLFVDEGKLMKPLYTGLRKTIQRGVFASLKAPLPPPDEQAAIVRFLDHANRKIDGFIRAKRKLIGLLNEQKLAIIHRAVTRGLHPDVPLKPSGIPWLAEAPANWTWIPIKLLLSRMDYGTSEKSTASGSIRILTMGNIQKGEVTVPRSGGLNCLPDSLLLQHHDLLFTRTNGNPNLVGKVGIFRGELSDRISFASYLVRLRVKRLYDPEWLHMVLNSAAFWPFARSHALVNLQTNLNSTRYGQFAVPVPPLAEQKEIVKWVGGESVNLNTAIARTEREIALMQEYRTRLTADLVTGKLDVREAAAKLPEVEVEPVAEEFSQNAAGPDEE